MGGEFGVEDGEVLEIGADRADDDVFFGEVVGLGQGDFGGGAEDAGFAFPGVGDFEADEGAPSVVATGGVRVFDDAAVGGDESAVGGFA